MYVRATQQKNEKKTAPLKKLLNLFHDDSEYISALARARIELNLFLKNYKNRLKIEFNLEIFCH